MALGGSGSLQRLANGLPGFLSSDLGLQLKIEVLGTNRLGVSLEMAARPRILQRALMIEV